VAATLSAIRTKVRRLTRSPSVSQLTDADIDEYINTFILYDFPAQLHIYNTRTTFTFYTQPYQDTYGNSTTIGDDFYNFDNIYVSANQPAYCAGYKLMWSQSREQFYKIFPQIMSINSIGTTGNGVTTTFTGTLGAVPIERGKVVFSTKDASSNGLFLTDYANGVEPSGILAGDGFGSINYLTGAFTLNFSAAPGSGEIISSETVPYNPARPSALLFFDNKFILRPIPDQTYQVSVEVYERPTALLDAASAPRYEEWWQYIAYGAAKKVFEDRSDLESVNLIMPEFKRQEIFVLRRTIIDMSKERASTIYVEPLSPYSGAWDSGLF